MRIARVPCGISYTLPHLYGSLSDRCELPGTPCEVFVKSGVCRWSYGANKIQIHTDVKLLGSRSVA